ncbi:MFS transporter [Novispirillum itersonii subsp. nipponicum]
MSTASALLAAAVGASYAYVDLSLNRMGVSASAIGLNASMPALAWLLATPLMPWALRRFNPKALLPGLLAVAILAILCFPALPDADVWMALRFLFGGGTGMVFRLVEYWINAGSPENRRARNVGIYATTFAVGIMTGATVTPLIGTEGWPPVLMMAILALAAGLVFAFLHGGPPPIKEPPPMGHRGLFRGAARLPLLGVLLFGLFEAAPYTMMPVYAVRSGLEEHWAAWCVSATFAGLILMAIPIGILADRFGKVRVLVSSAVIALIIPALIPSAMQSPEVLLLTMLVWGGSAGSFYNLTLAMLADHFKGAGLATANASFGTLYAVGSLCGPILHGLSMDSWNPQGLMISTAALFALFLCVSFWQSVTARGAICTIETDPSPD